MYRDCKPVEGSFHGLAFSFGRSSACSSLWPQKLTLGHATVDNMFREATRRTKIEIQEMLLDQLDLGLENKDSKGQAAERKDGHKKQLASVGLDKDDVDIDADDDEAQDADEEANIGLDELAEHQGVLVLLWAAVVWMQGIVH